MHPVHEMLSTFIDKAVRDAMDEVNLAIQDAWNRINFHALYLESSDREEDDTFLPDTPAVHRELARGPPGLFKTTFMHACET